MRPGQNKRMRGRNRKGPNPLSRSYESNGPDVKVRGTAAHVAEKYVQLARDAHSSGDPVSAESYLQHAEHYYRLLMAAQQVQPQQNFQQNGFQPRGQEVETDDSDEFDEDFDGGVMDRFTFRAPQQAQPLNANGQPYYGNEEGGEGAEQPRIDPARSEQPRVDARQDGNPRQDGGRQDSNRNDGGRNDNRDSRQDQQRFDNRGPRNDRDRNNNRFRDRDPNRDPNQHQSRELNREPNRDRDYNRDQNRDRDPSREQNRERGERNDRGERAPYEPRQPRPVLVQPPEPIASALPAFITGGRQPSPADTVPESAVPQAVAEQAAGEEFAPRPRRRRRTKAEMAAAAAGAGNDEADIPPAAE